MDNDSSFDCLKTTYKEFSEDQKKAIIAENRKRNGGTVKSDVADDSHKTLSGSSPADDSPEIDHIIPKSVGGSNAYANAQVTSRKYNNSKRAKYGD